MPIALDDICFNKASLMGRCLVRDRLGMPQSSAEAFVLLEQKELITPATARSLSAMVGFR